MENFIKVNIGGKIFVLDQKIIGCFELFDGIKMCTNNEDFIPFIDMDPIIFKHILDKIEKNETIDSSYSLFLDYLNYRPYGLSPQVLDKDKEKEQKTNYEPINFLLTTNETHGLIQLVAESMQFREGSYSDFLKKPLVYNKSVFRFHNYEINIEGNVGKTTLIRTHDVIDLLYIGIEYDEDKIIDIEQLIESISINNIYHCTGLYLASWNKSNESSNVHYIKIPFLHSKKHFLSLITSIMYPYEIKIKFKNMNFKKTCITSRSFYLDANIRRKLAQSTLNLLVHQPVEMTAKNQLWDNNINFNIETKYVIRDFEFQVKELKSATLYCDDKIRWKYDAIMLRKIIPLEVLGKELEPDHYYFSFSEDHDFTQIIGYGDYRGKTCRLCIELFDGSFVHEAKLTYHQVYYYCYNVNNYHIISSLYLKR